MTSVGRIEGKRKETLEIARNRLMVGVLIFSFAFLSLAVRALNLGLVENVQTLSETSRSTAPVLASRSDIVDRNGVVLATNLETSSLYANPRNIQNAEEAAQLLISVLPELSKADVASKLSSSKSFVWLKRKLTPKQMWAVNVLGIPGLKFQQEEERIYPQGKLAAHVLGYVDIDGKGLAGVEHFFEDRLSDPARVGEPLKLSIDYRVQHALEDEVAASMAKFHAVGAAGVVMNVNTGEVVAMASFPDFDPNLAEAATATERFNRASKGVYELGSTFKTFTVALGLDTGTVSLNDVYDASKPMRISSRFSIHDDHPQNRPLNVKEIFAYSSNIGAARMVMDIGGDKQREFLDGLGLLRPSSIELTEVGRPMYPKRWADINAMTISYGHGIAVSPLQLSTSIATMVNGGYRNPATLISQPMYKFIPGDRIVTRETSAAIRQLMRVVVDEGTGSFANVPGYMVGGKTGTAEKAIVGGYDKTAVLSSFVGVFPMDDPEYVVFVLLDEPKGNEQTYNNVGGGWVAAPAVGNIIARIAPLLGVEPRDKPSGFQQISLGAGAR
jgi:cell division protein FtsI (penicillin-binding protein 3)